MSKRFRRLSHTIYECKYHLVFCPKYRRAILKDEIQELCKTGDNQSAAAEGRD